jgi:outer membrane protein assembly factor BamB
MEAYSTPIPCENSFGRKILIVGGNYTTAHDPDTGAELWRFGGLNVRGELHWRHVTSPVTADGIAVVCSPRGDPVLAIRDGGQGVVTESHLAWKFKDTPADCVTPLVYQNRLYVLDGDHQNIACLEPATGRKLWQGNLGVREIFRASPAGADGKIYCVGEGGTVVVLAAGDEFKTLASVPMHEGPVRSSIAVAHGRLFLRTAKNLYCIRKP